MNRHLEKHQVLAKTEYWLLNCAPAHGHALYMSSSVWGDYMYDAQIANYCECLCGSFQSVMNCGAQRDYTSLSFSTLIISSSLFLHYQPFF